MKKMIILTLSMIASVGLTFTACSLSSLAKVMPSHDATPPSEQPLLGNPVEVMSLHDEIPQLEQPSVQRVNIAELLWRNFADDQHMLGNAVENIDVGEPRYVFDTGIYVNTIPCESGDCDIELTAFSCP